MNIAARLEALAQTNGITVSKVIYDFVNGKTQFEFNDLGLQKIKKNEFHAFDLLLNSSHQKKSQKKHSKPKSIGYGNSHNVYCTVGISIFFME